MNVPFRYSSNAICSSSSVFITIGPYQATGSPMGLPDMSRKRTGSPCGRDRHLVAVVEEHRRSVVDVGIALHVEIVLAQGIVGKGVLLIAKDALAPDHVGEDRVAARGLVDELGKGRQRDVEIFGIDDDVPDRALSFPPRSRR